MLLTEYDEAKHFQKIKEEGREEGLSQGISVFIREKIDAGVEPDIINQKLQDYFALSPEKAQSYISEYGFLNKE